MTDNNKQFILGLADLMDKHKVIDIEVAEKTIADSSVIDGIELMSYDVVEDGEHAYNYVRLPKELDSETLRDLVKE